MRWWAALGLAAASLLAGCSFAPSGPATGPDQAAGPEPGLRVAVLVDVESVRISGHLLELHGGPQDGSLLAPGDDVTVTAGTLAMQLVSTGASARLAPACFRSLTGPLTLRTLDNVVELNGAAYHGAVEVRLSLRGKLTVVNHVSIEDYLPGVLPNEIGCERVELLEAMKAQAIAARTYALANRNRYADAGYDLLATVSDQVYSGIPGEKPFGTQAVRATAGVVATWHGQPIQMNYASTCGGHTASRDEAFDQPPLPYLKGVKDKGGDGSWCAGSKYFTWREVWTASEFMAGVRDNAARELGGPLPEGATLRDVKVARRSPSGRVAQLDVITDKGTFSAHRDRIRWAIRRAPGGEPLRSTLFQVKVRKVRDLVKEVTIEGRGWGHGVGLCQVGAMERARRGQDCAEILNHYYRGIRLKRIYR